MLAAVRRLTGGADPDAELVGRAAAGCPDAVAALVARHGPMVAGVCRRHLRGPDADDAYQAVWLVFLRRAGAVRGGAVGPFLYGVAVRTCRKLRGRRRWASLPDVPDLRPKCDPELAGLIDVELLRLPAGMRAAVLLCEVEGRSLKAAAADLGLPVGTLASRLARGRQKLADGLRRRGVTVSAAALSGWLASEGVAAPPAGPATPAAVTLSRRVLTMLVVERLRPVAAGLLLATGGLAAGGGGLVRATAPPPAPAERKPDAELTDLWGRLCLPDEGAASVSLLRLGRRPAAELVPFLRTRLRPVTLTRAEADGLLAKLLGDDPAASRVAASELYYRNPRLVMTVDEVWAMGKTARDRQRLAAVLVGEVEGHDHLDYALRRIEDDAIRGDGRKVVRYNLKFDWLPDAPDDVVAKAGTPKRGRGGVVVPCEAETHDIWSTNVGWAQAARGVSLLEAAGSPEAVAHLEAVAGGHPNARPTYAAKQALTRLAGK